MATYGINWKKSEGKKIICTYLTIILIVLLKTKKEYKYQPVSAVVINAVCSVSVNLGKTPYCTSQTVPHYTGLTGTALWLRICKPGNEASPMATCHYTELFFIVPLSNILLW